MANLAQSLKNAIKHGHHIVCADNGNWVSISDWPENKLNPYWEEVWACDDSGQYFLTDYWNPDDDEDSTNEYQDSPSVWELMFPN